MIAGAGVVVVLLVFCLLSGGFAVDRTIGGRLVASSLFPAGRRGSSSRLVSGFLLIRPPSSNALRVLA